MNSQQQPIVSEIASILVVDDTSANLDLLDIILRSAQYEVRLVPNGAMALRSVLAEAPDLILLDIRMPGMDGYEVCAQLKADTRTCDIPVIFISALQDTEDKVRAFSIGGVDYVIKPFQADEVLARVATHLRIKRLQKALQVTNEQLRELLDEQLRTRQQLEEAAAVFHVSNEGIMLTDAKGIIRQVNPAFSHITGYSAEEVIGKTPRLLKSGHHTDAFYKSIWHTLNVSGYWEGEIWNRRKDGSLYLEWEMITAIRNSKGENIGYISQFSDLVRRQLTEQEIMYCGNYDALTGLANRALLIERLSLAIKEHRRKERKLALMLIDLNKFKLINDTLGYICGDMLLKQAAKRISEELREIDTAARLSGDEFMVMLTDLENQTFSERVATRLIDSLSKTFNLEGNEAQLAVSIGIAVFPDDGNTVEALFRSADLAINRAKENGQYQAQFFTEEMEREFLARSKMEADLRLAVKREEFLIYYQPIMELHSNKCVGVESLIRWLHPVLGLVPPNEFIPIAEETGLINSIGEWMITKVCKQLNQWQSQGLSLYASVNVSAQQIPHNLSPTWLEQVLLAEHLKPELLVLEITESMFVQDITAVAKWIEQIRQLGIRIYLDDFGTGYTSLSYLKHFFVDALKIDQAFVREVATQGMDQSLVRAILALGESLDLQVVAEGIETQEQSTTLHHLKCHYGQGYLFSKPLPIAEFDAWLRQSMVTYPIY